MSTELAAYAPVLDMRVRALVVQARQLLERGKAREAEPLLRQAEREAPRHPLVMNLVAARLLARGKPAEAVALLEQAARAEPRDHEVLHNLMRALDAEGRAEEALEVCERLLALNPRSVSGLLAKASLQERLFRPRDAAMTYRTALQLVPPGIVAPPELAAPLDHARRAVEANDRALEDYIAEGLGRLRDRFGDEPLSRFDQCVDILLQKRRIFRQQPTFLFFPELPAIEFYDRKLFPWLDRLEAAADDIRNELVAVLSEGSGVLEPYVADQAGMSMEQWGALNNSRRWGVYPLWREGRAYPDHIARCPKTMQALADWPPWDIPENGPTALFSILDAKTRIPPHTGPVNTRLVVHLPLIVPPGCGFRVGGQQREWQPGKAFVFDDSINHEAWNEGELPRAVLILDTWSPYLTEAERALTRALTERVGEWYGTMSNSRGNQG